MLLLTEVSRIRPIIASSSWLLIRKSRSRLSYSTADLSSSSDLASCSARALCASVSFARASSYSARIDDAAVASAPRSSNSACAREFVVSISFGCFAL